MIAPHLDLVPWPRPSSPTFEEDAFDQALRESFPASEAPAWPALPPRRFARLSEAIDQAMIGWSPSTEASTWSLVLGEAPRISIAPPDDAELPPREILTLIPWTFGQQRYDAVDEALAESFPASDPPAWTP